MKLEIGKDIHVPMRMNSNNFGDPLTFHSTQRRQLGCRFFKVLSDSEPVPLWLLLGNVGVLSLFVFTNWCNTMNINTFAF